MKTNRRPPVPVPVAAALTVSGVLVGGIAGWAGIAALATSGPVGLSVLAGMVLVPGGAVAVQALRMPPAARRPLPVPQSDREACPVTGRACDGAAAMSGAS